MQIKVGGIDDVTFDSRCSNYNNASLFTDFSWIWWNNPLICVKSSFAIAKELFVFYRGEKLLNVLRREAIRKARGSLCYKEQWSDH